VATRRNGGRRRRPWLKETITMNTPELQKSRIGHEVGLSEWLLVDQSMIDRFADLTFDHQFIHVDPVAAQRTPFGSTIAHGFLVLSLLSKLAEDANIRLDGAVMGMNYGFDKVRMTGPVRSGKRIRGRFVLKDFVERAPKQWLSTLGVTVEVEGESKPAVIADWLGLQFTG
jgi:acyl dehydratase